MGYYLAGYLLTTFTVTERTQRVARWLVVAGWLATAIGSGALAARYGWTADGNFLYDYLSPTVMLMSLGRLRRRAQLAPEAPVHGAACASSAGRPSASS